jgi:hypothetical protein
MVSVFTSYRRNDSQGSSGRLYDRLISILDKENVFMDIDNISPGDDFEQELLDALNRSTVMLVVIGPRWLSERDNTGRRRIDNEKDYVHMEIAKALSKEISVIPTLVENSSLPSEDELPRGLGKLCKKQAVSLRHENFAGDVDRLAESIREISNRRNTNDAYELGLAIARRYNQSIEFKTSVEIDFAQAIEEAHGQWYYNPHPYGGVPRFIVQGLPDLGKELYRLDVVDELNDEIREHYSNLTLDPLLIAAPAETQEYGDLRDYDLWEVDFGAWSKHLYIRCESCETLQFDTRDNYSNDELAEMDGMYEEWCPHCETTCERCGGRTGHANLCSSCQCYYDKYMTED